MDVDSSYIVESDMGKAAEEETARIIGKYAEKPPAESGLLTTARYVSKKMTGRDLPDIVRGVQKILGAKYREEDIIRVVKELS